MFFLVATTRAARELKDMVRSSSTVRSCTATTWGVPSETTTASARFGSRSADVVAPLWRPDRKGDSIRDRRRSNCKTVLPVMRLDRLVASCTVRLSLVQPSGAQTTQALPQVQAWKPQETAVATILPRPSLRQPPDVSSAPPCCPRTRRSGAAAHSVLNRFVAYTWRHRRTRARGRAPHTLDDVPCSPFCRRTSTSDRRRPSTARRRRPRRTKDALRGRGAATPTRLLRTCSSARVDLPVRALAGARLSRQHAAARSNRAAAD